jgi:hypothetical protein
MVLYTSVERALTSEEPEQLCSIPRTPPNGSRNLTAFAENTPCDGQAARQQTAPFGGMFFAAFRHVLATIGATGRPIEFAGSRYVVIKKLRPVNTPDAQLCKGNFGLSES